MPFSSQEMVHQQTRWAVFLYIDISLGSIPSVIGCTF